MTKIIGFAGRKQAGKNTCCNYIVGRILKKYNRLTEFHINQYGELCCTENKLCKDIEPNYVNIYSCADALKQLCINILGLTHEQCYGTNAQKNSLTNIRWEDLPQYVEMLEMYNAGLSSVRSGYMLAREVLQEVGTGIFRRMYNNVWVDTLMRQIKRDGYKYALVADVRFPNEANGIKTAGGKVVRLTRAPFPEDTHVSEISLDNYKDFDYILDNKDLSINESLALLENQLQLWNL